MKAIVITSLFAAFALIGCTTSQRTAGDFVRTTNFGKLDTFFYKHTLASGMSWRDSDHYVVEELSKQVLTQELLDRGFSQVEKGSDFFVVTKWRKALSSYPSNFQHIDGPHESINDSRRPDHKAAVRYTLIVEFYETGTRNLFWRAELANIFDAIQFTEERVAASLRRAVTNFPQHLEKDPNLPTIE